ncbi:type IV secretion system protein VirD4 [Gammaproteobacteria bacterium]
MYPKNTDKAKKFTRGGQITFHNLRMLLQVNKTVWNIYFVAFIVLSASAIYFVTPKDIWWSAWYWLLAQVNSILKLLNIKMGQFLVPYHGKIYRISPDTYLSYNQFAKNAAAIIPYIKSGVTVGFVLSIGVFYGLVKWLIMQGEKQTASQFIRGSKLDVPESVAKQIKKDKMNSDIVIDNMPMIKNSETKHFLVHGSTGSGKTQLISKILDCLRKRGDRVFLYDKGGVYTSMFYRDGLDKILNPFDARCENWNLWREARTATDFENMAESLIPMHGESDPFWVNASRTIFGSTAFTMQDDDDRSVKKLLKILLTSELNDLHNYLAGTEAATLTSGAIEKTAISIRSVITTYLKSLRFLIGAEQTSEKPKFSIRDWICNEQDSSWLFLSSNAAQHASLKPLLSMWFSMATITLLSLPENRNRRLWFVCDELPSLHKLPQLPESIAEARKYGGCFVLGMQSYAQLEKVYGKSAGREIFDLMNTAFFFRSPSPDTAELVSRALGNQEIEDMRENYSYGANTIRDGISIGTQRMINQIVTSAEIMELEEMRCFLRLAAPYPITLLKLTLDERSKLAEGFVSNDIVLDQEVEKLVERNDSRVRKFYAMKKEDIEAKKSKEAKENKETLEAQETQEADGQNMEDAKDKADKKDGSGNDDKKRENKASNKNKENKKSKKNEPQNTSATDNEKITPKNQRSLLAGEDHEIW